MSFHGKAQILIHVARIDRERSAQSVSWSLDLEQKITHNDLTEHGAEIKLNQTMFHHNFLGSRSQLDSIIGHFEMTDKLEP